MSPIDFFIATLLEDDVKRETLSPLLKMETLTNDLQKNLVSFIKEYPYNAEQIYRKYGLKTLLYSLDLIIINTKRENAKKRNYAED